VLDVNIVNNAIKLASAGVPQISIVPGLTNAGLQSGNRFSTGPCQGRAVLVAGAATVATTEIQAADNVILSRVLTGGTTGQLSVGAIVAGESFVINSSASTDTSTIYWKIDH
jgi:hypothetical protein